MPRSIPLLRWPITVASVAAICSATVVVSHPAHGQQPEFRPQVVVNRVFPTITNPPTIAADKAATKVKDNELVLGVTVGDQSRAYPINMLTGPRREIINDQLGNRYIAATW
jgi:hypothetical protein